MPHVCLISKVEDFKGGPEMWKKNTFGNVHTQVTSAYKELDDIQMKIDNTAYLICLWIKKKLLKSIWKML